MEYCFVVSIMFWPGDDPAVHSTTSGAWTPVDGDTRLSIFRQIRERAYESAGATPDTTPVVTFFYLEPNELD